MKFLIIFIYLITSSFSCATEKPDIKNIIINKNLKIYKEVIFKDIMKKDIDIANYKGKLLVLNFWATWCPPCREEMPSLEKLQSEWKSILIVVVLSVLVNTGMVDDLFKMGDNTYFLHLNYS